MKRMNPAIEVATLCIILSAIRIPLKLFNIDIVTGFYDSSNIFGLVYNCIFFFSLAFSGYLCFKNKEDYNVPLRNGIVRCILTIISGISILISAMLRMSYAINHVSHGANSLPLPLLNLTNILGIISGAVIIFMALTVLSGSNNKFVEIISLLPPLWCAFFALTDFMTFRFVITASDQLMQTIFMLSATLFFLALSREIIMKTQCKIKYIIPAAFTILSGVPLAIGQLSVLTLISDQVSGPTLFLSIEILGICLLASIFILTPTRKA